VVQSLQVKDYVGQVARRSAGECNRLSQIRSVGGLLICLIAALGACSSPRSPNDVAKASEAPAGPAVAPQSLWASVGEIADTGPGCLRFGDNNGPLILVGGSKDLPASYETLSCTVDGASELWVLAFATLCPLPDPEGACVRAASRETPAVYADGEKLAGQLSVSSPFIPLLPDKAGAAVGEKFRSVAHWAEIPSGAKAIQVRPGASSGIWTLQAILI